jgi:hypothetical protein
MIHNTACPDRPDRVFTPKVRIAKRAPPWRRSERCEPNSGPSVFFWENSVFGVSA